MILSEEQQLIRETARAFAEAEIAPNAATWDREARFPREAIEALGAKPLRLREHLLHERLAAKAGHDAHHEHEVDLAQYAGHRLDRSRRVQGDPDLFHADVSKAPRHPNGRVHETE